MKILCLKDCINYCENNVHLKIGEQAREGDGNYIYAHSSWCRDMNAIGTLKSAV